MYSGMSILHGGISVKEAGCPVCSRISSRVPRVTGERNTSESTTRERQLVSANMRMGNQQTALTRAQLGWVWAAISSQYSRVNQVIIPE